jgi:hypothetical protein
MFPNASPIKTAARTAAALNQQLEGYRATVANWYDGTPRSIEARIAHCDRLTHRLRAAGIGHQGTVAELADDRRVLVNLAASLNNAHQDREVERTATRNHPVTDQINMVSARAFVREHIEVAHVPSELAERARRHAARHEPRADAEGFAQTCLRVAAQVPRPTVAAAPPIEDFPDYGLFM